MQVKVYPIRRKGRSAYILRYKAGGKVIREATSGTSRRREAYRLAREAEAEANRPNNAWALAADSYEDERAWDSKSNRQNWATARRGFEQFAAPARLSDASTRQLTRWAASLREAGRSEATIRTHLIHIGALLNWAVEQELLDRSPKMKLPALEPGNGGFPITGEELDRLLEAADKIMGQAAPGWRRLILGLRWSGLRLGEAHRLWWDGETSDAIWPLRLSRKRMACFRFRRRTHKGRREELVKMAEEFRQFLLETPPARRRGRVFRVYTRDRGNEVTWLKSWSQILRDIGEAAGITREGRPFTAKWLRCTFGTALAKKNVPPIALKHLMRHRDIRTTYRYYVHLTMGEIADLLDEGGDLGDTVLEETADHYAQ
jgi:site-specific recombinase XerD